MTELSANALQNVLPNTAVVFTEVPVRSSGGLIWYREGTGLVRLASPSRIIGKFFGGCPCNRRMLEAVYQVAFHANIAVPTGETVGPISLGIAIDGTVDPSSAMIFTPAAVETFGNVGAEILVGVPSICGCESIAVVNTSTIPIDVQNANLVVDYSGIKL